MGENNRSLVSLTQHSQSQDATVSASPNDDASKLELMQRQVRCGTEPFCRASGIEGPTNTILFGIHVTQMELLSHRNTQLRLENLASRAQLRVAGLLATSPLPADSPVVGSTLTETRVGPSSEEKESRNTVSPLASHRDISHCKAHSITFSGSRLNPSSSRSPSTPSSVSPRSAGVAR